MRMIAAALAITLVMQSHAGTPLQHAPHDADELINPYQGQPDAVLAGAKLYRRHCATCHGQEAAGRATIPPLHSTSVRKASPGAIFWVLRNGFLEHGMPSYSRLPEQQRWQLVTYLKNLQK